MFIDAPGLVDEDYRRYTKGKDFDEWFGSKGGAIEFIQNFGKGGFVITLFCRL